MGTLLRAVFLVPFPWVTDRVAPCGPEQALPLNSCYEQGGNRYWPWGARALSHLGCSAWTITGQKFLR